MKRHVGRVSTAMLLLFLLPAPDPSAASDNWPQFRGPKGTAVVADDPALPESWSATDNVAWQTPIPGRGWSSPIVWGNRIFVTSVVAEEDYEGPRPGLYLPETGNETPPDPPPGTRCCRARGTDGNWTRVDRKMLWSPAASSSQQRARVLTDVKARRFAPPPLRGADGLDVGAAHARPDWLLPTMPTHTPTTCCCRRPVQNDALSSDR